MNKYAYIEWFCDGCGERLDLQDGFTRETGTWICTECGEYNDVTDDNIIEEVDDDEIDEVNEEEDIPECCEACGGPYPLCKDGCPIFDDD